MVGRLRPIDRSEPYTRRAQSLGDGSLRVISTLEQYGPLGADNRRRQLGRSVLLKADTDDVRAQRAATLVSTGATRANPVEARGRNVTGPSLGESLAQEMVITCSKRLVGTIEGNSKARVLGHLKWGGDGHACEAFFDVLEGTTVRPVGSFARLDVELVEQLNGDEPTSDVEVGAFIGYGASLAHTSATLSDMATTTVPTPTAEFVIPPFAVGWQWWGNVSLGVEWLDGTAVLFAGLGASAQPLTTRGQILPVAPATTLRVTPSAPGNVIITWVLAI